MLKALRDGRFLRDDRRDPDSSRTASKVAGDQRTISADVEWTFPLSFVEVVWGDGTKIDRQVIAATDLAGVRHEAIRHSLRSERESVGSIRRVGLGRQWRFRSAIVDSLANVRRACTDYMETDLQMYGVHRNARERFAAWRSSGSADARGVHGRDDVARGRSTSSRRSMPTRPRLRISSKRVDAYVALHNKVESMLQEPSRDGRPEAVVEHQRAFAKLMQKERPHAKPGDIVTKPMRDVIRRLLGQRLSRPGWARSQTIDSRYVYRQRDPAGELAVSRQHAVLERAAVRSCKVCRRFPMPSSTASSARD